MDQFFILLDQHIYHSPARSNRMFSTLKLRGHIEAAYDFKKNYPHTKIITKNYLNNLNYFLQQSDEREHIYLIYCGHGSPGKWNIGITKNQLQKSVEKIPNKITIVSDNCFSDTMNLAHLRPNVSFISAARATGSTDDTSAFFTFEGGYLSNVFYQSFRPKLPFFKLKNRILDHYFDDLGSNLHRPRFFE